MNKAEFLNALRTGIKSLPQEEIDSAIEYYSEYISDAEDELQAIKNLPHPKFIASKLIAECNIKEGSKSKSKLITVILAVLSAPITFPLAIAVIAMVFAVLVSVGAVALSGLLIIISLLVSAISAIPLIFTATTPANGIFITGFVTFALGFAVFACIIITRLVKFTVNSLKIKISKVISKGHKDYEKK